MSDIPEYEHYDGLGLAALVRRGEVRPRELVEAAIARIEARDAAVNAIVHRAYEAALTTADRRPRLAGEPGAGPGEAGGAFAGVPFLVKDLMALVTGQPMTAGSRFLAGYVPDHDTELVRRYRQAGLLLLGKTNTPEFGVAFTTEPRLHGATRNPWDPELSPGGSSGGSAAAVAAGYVPMAHGSDAGGSIRVPAAACGLFGLKPSRARTPTGPDYGRPWFGLGVEHAITRSVRDSAALLDATAGPDVGAPDRAAPPERPFLDEVGADPGRLRIAVFTGSLMGSGLHPDVREAVIGAAGLCSELGHHVEEAAPDLDAELAARTFLTLVAAATAQEIALASRAVGREPRRGELEPETALLRLIGRRLGGDELALALHDAQLIGRGMAAFMEDHDVFLCATTAAPPRPLGGLRPAPWQRLVVAGVRRLPVRRLLDTVLESIGSEVLEACNERGIATDLIHRAGLPMKWIHQNSRRKQLAEAGITASINSLEWSEWLEREGNFQYDAYICNWNGLIDADQYYYLQHHTGEVFNFTGYSDEEFDQLVEEGRSISDFEERYPIYEEANQILVDDAPYIYMYNKREIRAYAPEVQGFVVRPDQANNFWTVWLDE